MRIAIMALNFASGQPGSHEAHLPQLVHAMVQRDSDDFFLLLLRSDNRSSFPAPGPNVAVVNFPRLCRHKIVQVFCEQVIVPLILALRGVDLLHFPTNIRPLFTPCRTVGTVHWVLTPLLMRAFSLPKRLYFSFFERTSFRKAQKLIAVSESSGKELVANGVPEGKVVVIRHAISDRFRSKNGAREAVPLLARPGYLLYAGTSAPYKNVGTLLDVYFDIRKRNIVNDQLLLAGNIDANVIAEAVRRNDAAVFGNDVILGGYVPYESMPALYRAASVAVSLSLQETFGLVLLEAMASGVPLIVSAIPAYREIGEGIALLVDPRDRRAVADAFERLVRDPELKDEMVRKGLSRAAESTWEYAAEKTLAVYRGALKS